LLKGALLFDLWFEVPHRPTRDIDFLGFGSAELSLMESTFKEISAIPEDDGVIFDPDTVRATEIRKDANYAGVRVGLLGSIGALRACPDRHPCDSLTRSRKMRRRMRSGWHS
jgi:hypothetical protein